MKLEYGISKPDVLVEKWNGQYSVFSWMEYVTAIPQPLFLITTFKDNNKANACFHAWSTFTGEGENYFCILSILKNQHTYENIIKRKDFCVNFPESKYLDMCYSTIHNNDYSDDEISNSGFTSENAMVVNAPRIKECFINMECSLEWEKSLFDGSSWILLCGRIKHLSIDKQRVEDGIQGRYGNTGYMFNIHSPKNPVDGTEVEDKIGIIEILK